MLKSRTRTERRGLLGYGGAACQANLHQPVHVVCDLYSVDTDSREELLWARLVTWLSSRKNLSIVFQRSCIISPRRRDLRYKSSLYESLNFCDENKIKSWNKIGKKIVAFSSRFNESERYNNLKNVRDVLPSLSLPRCSRFFRETRQTVQWILYDSHRTFSPSSSSSLFFLQFSIIFILDLRCKFVHVIEAKTSSKYGKWLFCARFAYVVGRKKNVSLFLCFFFRHTIHPTIDYRRLSCEKYPTT